MDVTVDKNHFNKYNNFITYIVKFNTFYGSNLNNKPNYHIQAVDFDLCDEYIPYH